MSDSKKQSAGFTLPELVVSISLIGIISISLLSALTYYFANVTRNNLLIEMTDNSQSFLRVTVEQLRYSAGVRQSNTVADPHAPSGGWNTSNSNFVIIIALPATDSSNNYVIDPSTGGPYENEIVYFKQGTTLYKRTLANPNATGNTLKTSCPASIATKTCPADASLLDYLDNMVFTLYDQNNTVTTDPLAARSVNIDLSMKHNTFGGPLLFDNNVRVTLRNTY